MTTEPRWLIGLELSPRCGGALQFARFLRRTIHARVGGVYVQELWLTGVPPGEAAAYAFRLRAEAEKWLDTLAAGAPEAAVDATEILDQIDAETGLASIGRGAAGILVGRRVASERGWSHLGRVARRLLRSLPAPVIVVPPELASDAFAGPVVFASDLTAASVGAARFATALARALDRRLVCVHMGEPRWSESFDYTKTRWQELRRQYREATDQAALAWVTEHCAGAELVIEYGTPVDQLPAVAARLEACLLVVGSKRLGLVERIFTGSTASAVAATATCAVAVVPPDAPFSGV